EWGARSPTSTSALNPLVPYVVIHHTEGPPCSTRSSCIRRVKGIQDFHMDTRGWADIGYKQEKMTRSIFPRSSHGTSASSFLVGEDGNVYEGRGWSKQGAHAPNYNSRSIGISVIGNFMKIVPNPAATTALKSLIACGTRLGKIRGNYSLIGHRQTKSTECPGDALYKEITTWNHYNPKPK
ncbi:unnamed protein product, partial [Darwinula stevensoni]